MLRSRVVLALLALAGGLSITGVANADEDGSGMLMGSPYGYGYTPSTSQNLYYLPAKSAYVDCRKVGARYHHGVLVSHRHWSCGMYSVRYVCAKTVSTISPIHRDTYCSVWAMERVQRSHWGRAYLYR
jgi:hypothetical protein